MAIMQHAHDVNRFDMRTLSGVLTPTTPLNRVEWRGHTAQTSGVSSCGQSVLAPIVDRRSSSILLTRCWATRTQSEVRVQSPTTTSDRVGRLRRCRSTPIFIPFHLRFVLRGAVAVFAIVGVIQTASTHIINICEVGRTIHALLRVELLFVFS